MGFLRRMALLALLCSLGAPLTGCAGRQGSSFETLGIPRPEDRPGRGPVILGWARENRSGWIIQRVSVDNRSRSEWNEESQRPTIFYLAPGIHEIRLRAAQLRDPQDPNSRPRRRYRVRPFRVDVEEGLAQVCTVRIVGDRRPRPRVRCQVRQPPPEPEPEPYEDEYDEYGDEYAEDEEIAAAAEPEPRAPGPETPPEAETAPPAAEEEHVPSPFDPPAGPRPHPTAEAEPPAAEPEPEPVPAPPSPEPAVTPSSRPRPRPLTLEERVERLERQLEELRRQLREQGR